MKLKLKIKKVWIVALLVCFGFSSNVLADDNELLSKLNAFEKKMSEMQRTIDSQNDKIRKLENQAPVTVSGNSVAEPPPPMSDFEFNERLNTSLGGANKWLKDLKFSGDLRLRYEAFQNGSGNPSETDDRNRFRYRLRYGFEKKFSEEMKIGFSMASGETSGGQNVDPTSTNTSFDNNFNFKSIYVETAYASYSPAWAQIGPIETFNLTAGKLKNLFEKGSSDIIWDRDVRPEGIYEKVDLNLIDSENFDMSTYFTAGQFVLDEDSAAGGDAELFAYQLGINPILYTPFFDRPVDLLSAVSFYSWNDYAVGSNFLIGTTSLARGNFNTAGSATELDAQDFEVWDFYNELSFYPMGMPVRPFIDFAVNTANQRVGEDDSYAFALGTKLGGIVKKGDWEVSYAYKRIGSEATPGFNDSDFGAAGHSGVRGSVIKGGYAITDQLQLNSAAIFVNNLNTGTASIRDEQQARFQLDLVWKF